MVTVTEGEFEEIMYALGKAGRTAVGFEVDYSEVDDRWMGIFLRTIEVVRDAIIQDRKLGGQDHSLPVTMTYTYDDDQPEDRWPTCSSSSGRSRSASSSWARA